MALDETHRKTANDLARFGSHTTVLLETRKRDGSWVGTPVSLVVEGDRAYFRTYDVAGKTKRLRNFPEVHLAPSTLRGKPKGPRITAQARLLNGGEADHARDLLASSYPILHRRLVPWMHRRKGWTTEHYGVTVER
jgi:PPOX class probable F420-dependent enzyme